MMGASTRVTVNKDAAQAVRDGTQDALMHAATKGFNQSQAIVGQEATDTGNLQNSGIPPQRQPDGSVVWGYNAPYAEPVEEGSRPHWPPIQPLLGWARRVLGDESAAYAVQAKIAQEGTEPVGYVQRGIDTMRASLSSQGVSGFITERL